MKLTFLAVACAFFATGSTHVIGDVRAPEPPTRPPVPRRELAPSFPEPPRSEDPPKLPHAPRSPQFPDPYGGSFIAPQFEFGGFPANPPIPRMPEEIVRGLREGPRVPEEIEEGFAQSKYDRNYDDSKYDDDSPVAAAVDNARYAGGATDSYDAAEFNDRSSDYDRSSDSYDVTDYTDRSSAAAAYGDYIRPVAVSPSEDTRVIIDDDEADFVESIPFNDDEFADDLVLAATTTTEAASSTTIIDPVTTSKRT